MKWAYLLQLGQKMWIKTDRRNERFRGTTPTLEENTDVLVFDKEVWTEITAMLPVMGIDTLVIDLGEGVKYNSHPEIAAPNAWNVEELKSEIKRLKSMGITCIPKLNFATSHSMWLGKYHYMTCTDTYYQVCKDLIDEVCEIFGYPELFHLGMDEENPVFQQDHNYPLIICRQGDLWWHDTQYLIDCVEKNNVRAWIWCDMVFERDRETFVKRMPKSVLLSYWLYGRDYFTFPGHPNYDDETLRCKNYNYLDKHGFDQIPTGSNCSFFENMEMVGRYCKNEISKEHLKGLMMAPWYRVTPYTKYYFISAMDILRHVKEIDFGEK